MKIPVAGVALALFFATSVATPSMIFAQPAPSTPQPSTQAITAPVFVQMAAMSDMFEIQSSEAALKNSKDAEVRRFAQMMIDHHTKMSADLKAAVQAGNVSATMPTALTGEKAQILQKLQSASGEQFDRAYWQAQVQAHQEALQLVRGYAQGGDNQSLRQFAQKGVPIVEQHLQMAQKMMAGSKS